MLIPNIERAIRLLTSLGISRRTAYLIYKKIRILAVYREYRKRRKAAKQIITEKLHYRIDKNGGYVTFNTLPDICPVIDLCTSFYRCRLEDKKFLGSDKKYKKKFLINMFTPDDIPEEIVEYCSQGYFRDIVGDYLEEMPILRGVGLYLSQQNSTSESSQLFHFDYDDFKQIKCFINIFETNEDNGPFTFIDAVKSKATSKALKMDWRGGRLQDHEIFEIIGKGCQKRLVGKAGSGGFVDTSRCLHYGSRARQGVRLVLMFQYLSVTNIAILNHRKPHRPGDAVYIMK